MDFGTAYSTGRAAAAWQATTALHSAATAAWYYAEWAVLARSGRPAGWNNIPEEIDTGLGLLTWEGLYER